MEPHGLRGLLGGGWKAPGLGAPQPLLVTTRSLLASRLLAPPGGGRVRGFPLCQGWRGCCPPSLVQQVWVWPSPRVRQLLLQLQDAQPDVPRGQQQGHHPGDRVASGTGQSREVAAGATMAGGCGGGPAPGLTAAGR